MESDKKELTIDDMPKLDIAQLLKDDEEMAGYLSLMLESKDPKMILSAIGDVIRAKGINELSKQTGLNRESLYKTFQEGKSPRFETVMKIINALNLSLQVVPESAKAKLL